MDSLIRVCRYFKVIYCGNILQYQSGLGGDVKSLSKTAGKTIKPKEDNKSKNVLAKPQVSPIILEAILKKEIA